MFIAWSSWRLISLATRLFVLTNKTETSKHFIKCPLCGESTVVGEILFTKGKWCGKSSDCMTSFCRLIMLVGFYLLSMLLYMNQNVATYLLQKSLSPPIPLTSTEQLMLCIKYIQTQSVDDQMISVATEILGVRSGFRKCKWHWSTPFSVHISDLVQENKTRQPQDHAGYTFITPHVYSEDIFRIFR